MNAPAFMARRCRRTCGLCEGDELPGEASAHGHLGKGSAGEQEIRRHTNASTDCQRQPTARESVFVYVGSDLDIYPLHFLLCQERAVIFIDPLVGWRNEGAIADYLKTADPDAPTFKRFPDGLNGSPISDMDSFFECRKQGERLTPSDP